MRVVELPDDCADRDGEDALWLIWAVDEAQRDLCRNAERPGGDEDGAFSDVRASDAPGAAGAFGLFIVALTLFVTHSRAPDWYLALMPIRG
jgi:hypothetical protein